MLAMVALAVSGALAALVLIVAWTQPRGIRGTRPGGAIETVAPIVRETGVHTGTLVLSVASTASSPLLPATAATTEASELLQSWKAIGAAVVAHLPGPTLESEAAACSWVDSTSNALGGTGIPLPEGQRGARGIAIVYATSEPLPSKCAIPEIESWLEGASSVAVAFVTPDIDRSPPTSSDRIARGPALVLVGAALVAGGVLAASAIHLLAPRTTTLDIQDAEPVHVREAQRFFPNMPWSCARGSSEVAPARASSSASAGKPTKAARPATGVHTIPTVPRLPPMVPPSQ